MARYVELRRHTDADGDVLTQEGMRAARKNFVGDGLWDLLAARRAGMQSIGLLSGGYGEDGLMRSGAFRVYRDAAELRVSLDELGMLL